MTKEKSAYFRKRIYKKYLVYASFVSFGLVFWWLFPNSRNAPFSEDQNTSAMVHDPFSEDYIIGTKHKSRHIDRVERGESLNVALARSGLSTKESFLVTELLRKKINLRTIQPGEVIIIERGYDRQNAQSADALEPLSGFISFELVRTDALGLPVRYRLERKDNLSDSDPISAKDFDLSVIETQVSVSEEFYSGEITSNLYDAILGAGGDPSLVNRFSELFGWQVDFYRETQPGDRFQFVVEKKFADGRFFGFGSIKAAEFSNAGKIYRGFYYSSADGKQSGYFDENGVSLEKSFFKSPMQLTRITSRFGQRFHPVLGTFKKHNGIDYGAPTGTPFWSVADGTVLEARYSPTAGNMVRVKHSNGYVTEYFHASKIASGIRAGVKVKQKQILGYVGTTGRSTGPHLHFGMLQNKSYVNPSKQKIALEIVLPKKEIAEFKRTISPLLAQFEQRTSAKS